MPVLHSLSLSLAGGAAELAGKLHSSRPLYGFCRVEAPGSGQPRLVMIIWVSDCPEVHTDWDLLTKLQTAHSVQPDIHPIFLDC